MNHNHIANLTDELLFDLAKAIASNNTLTSLDLSSNAITDTGAQHLAVVLSRHTVREDFSLEIMRRLIGQ